jgi:hypothetical protein
MQKVSRPTGLAPQTFVPAYAFREITDISPDFLSKLGVRFLMIDLDNTVASYSEHTPSDVITQWIGSIRNGGVELFIISNSIRKGRVESFAEALGLDFIKGASKPSPKGVIRAMETAGFSAKESALVGDQVYTDTLAANRAGVVSIIVKPRSVKNPFLALRYALEAPFRAICKNKIPNSEFRTPN